jgi:hypothetical protein
MKRAVYRSKTCSWKGAALTLATVGLDAAEGHAGMDAERGPLTK